mmetsp:Transcript_101553/g.296012  ORF Transcript_101553/g.296012 Transcript_101553/m.296012 type:complete len:247 (-) Transcript_101553:477-1217(-)
MRRKPARRTRGRTRAMCRATPSSLQRFPRLAARQQTKRKLSPLFVRQILLLNLRRPGTAVATCRGSKSPRPSALQDRQRKLQAMRLAPSVFQRQRRTLHARRLAPVRLPQRSGGGRGGSRMRHSQLQHSLMKSRPPPPRRPRSQPQRKLQVRPALGWSRPPQRCRRRCWLHRGRPARRPRRRRSRRGSASDTRAADSPRDRAEWPPDCASSSGRGISATRRWSVGPRPSGRTRRSWLARAASSAGF